MFSILKPKKTKELYAPVVGESAKLTCVPDKVFASGMMGEGIAFKFEGETVYSPCDAKVILVAKTKHAIGLESNGLELLIHIGLDTVNLNGEGFEVLVKAGDKVKRGDSLIKINRSFMKSKNIDLMTPMIVTSKNSKLTIYEPSKVDLNSVVITIE